MPTTVYKSPLTPVRPSSQTQKFVGCDLPKEKIPYSKYTVPHFMDTDDEEKYIVNGKCHFNFMFILNFKFLYFVVDLDLICTKFIHG